MRGNSIENRQYFYIAWGKTEVQRGCNAIQNTAVQSIELQGNRGGIGKSRQNSHSTQIAKLAGAAPLMEAPLKPVPPALQGGLFYEINPLLRGWLKGTKKEFRWFRSAS